MPRLSGALQVRDLQVGVNDLLVALVLRYESKSLAPGRTLDRPALFAKGGCCADPGMRYTYSGLEQGYEQERVLTHAIGKAYSAIAAQANVSP